MNIMNIKYGQTQQELTFADFTKLRKGMPFTEMFELIGYPEKNVGFGIIGFLYRLSDGRTLVVGGTTVVLYLRENGAMLPLEEVDKPD